MTKEKREEEKQSKISAAAISAKEMEIKPETYKLKVFLAGSSGSGKTLSAMTLPGRILLVDFDGRSETVIGEPNVEILRCYEPDPRSPKAWQDAELIRKQIISETRREVFPYDSIVWDGITMLGRYALNWALTLDSGRGLGGSPAQQHYLPQMDNIAKFILSTLALPFNILYTGHIELIEETETGKVFYLPKVTGKLRTEISNWFAETYLCYRQLDEKEKRVRYYWITAGSARREFLKSTLNKRGKYWVDPVEVDFEQSPVGFKKLLEKRFPLNEKKKEVIKTNT